MIYFIFNLVFLLFNFKDIYSRPISYSDAWTIMQKNDYNKNSLHVHYTPLIKYSIGYRGEYWKNKEWSFHGAQVNYLLSRLNNASSQANFYLKSGVGVALSDYKNLEKEKQPSVFSGFSMDWENRRYYTSYENKFIYANKIDKFFLQKIRLGLSPYIGKYGDLHSWLMFQIDHMPKSKDKFIYTPFLRMFKGDYLAEAGFSNNKELMFNFIKRF